MNWVILGCKYTKSPPRANIFQKKSPPAMGGDQSMGLRPDYFQFRILWKSYSSGLGTYCLGGLVVGRGDGVEDGLHHRRELVRLDVHQTGRNLARRGVLQVLEVERRDVALRIDVNHAARLALGEELVHADTQLRAVGQVVGDRGLAADFVAQLHRTALDLEAQLLELLLDHLVEDVRLRHLAQLGMSVLVVGEVDAALADLLVADSAWNTPSEITAAP